MKKFLFAVIALLMFAPSKVSQSEEEIIIDTKGSSKGGESVLAVKIGQTIQVSVSDCWRPVVATIHDMDGELMYQETYLISGTGTFIIATSSLDGGTYRLSICGSQIHTGMFLTLGSNVGGILN